MKKLLSIITLAISPFLVSLADAPKKSSSAPKKDMTYVLVRSADADVQILKSPEGSAMRRREWGPEAERNFIVRAYCPIVFDKWTRVSMTLKCDTSKPITLVFGGDIVDDGRKARSFTLYDNIKINGKLVSGGDFEETTSEWNFMRHAKYPSRIVVLKDDQKFGAEGLGKRAISVNSIARASLEVNLKKGEPFGLSFDALAIDSKDGIDCDIPLNIKKFANMGIRDETAGDGIGGWTDEGKKKSMRRLKSKFGKSDFDGVSFEIIDPEKNSNSSVMAFKSPQMNTLLKSALIDISDNPVSANFLYILHSVSKPKNWYGSVPVGHIVVTYEDGEKVMIPVTYKKEVDDCWSPNFVRNGKIAFLNSKKKNKGALYMSRFRLDPLKMVKSVKFVSTEKMTWVVVAATLSPKEVIACDTTTPKGNSDWVIADMPDDNAVISGSALDFSHFWDGKPAGHLGRVIISERGTMAFEKTPEKDARFKGYTFYPKMLMESSKEKTRETVAKYATFLQKSGYNLVRINFDWVKADKKRAFRADQYDNIDIVFDELKKNGVYVHLPLAWYDIGLKNYHFDRRNDVKIRVIFGDKEVRDMWKETAEEQLNHVNKYTGIAWKDDPMFQVIEYYNELNICLTSFGSFTPETKKWLCELWRKWLAKRYGGDISKLNAVWKGEYWARGAGAPLSSFDDAKLPSGGFEWQHFCQDALDDYMEFCRKIVRGTGYKGIIVQRNLGRTYRDMWARQKTSESIISNSYYEHPVGLYSAGADTTCGQASSIEREVSYWRIIAVSKNYNRPLTVTEYNHCYWNKYRYEMMSVFPSYSAFQNFSALVIHANAVESGIRKKKRLSAFNVSDSPAIRSSELFNQCFFMRGDVKPSTHRVDMLISEEFSKSKNGAFALGGEQMRIPLIVGFATKADAENPKALSRVKVKPADLEVAPAGGAEVITAGWFQNVVDTKSGKFDIDKFVDVMKEKGILPKDNVSKPSKGIFQTDTMQIMIDSSKKFAKTVTEYSCVTTVEQSEEVDMGALKLLSTSVPASVGVASVDGKKISESSRLVFVFATQEDNYDSLRSKDNVLSIKGGMGPVVMRRGVVRADLKLDASKKYAVYPITLGGLRREKLDMPMENGVMKIEIDNGKLKNGAVAMFEIVEDK